ncbi:hypothetical protein EZV61_02710 [Corallincola luteus]|uniref:Type II secretion system protein GspG C-terminal domain-containing protein n=1 Tax=Corallincola luteus TaxID=1775177 RepID=A0ABY2AQN7_9GAMM|nr:type II secretion system protein GspG [Corallincola luteus]TCI04898.1 hypothetical protein EZV61_02710 [Corallincola luteus]
MMKASISFLIWSLFTLFPLECKSESTDMTKQLFRLCALYSSINFYRNEVGDYPDKLEKIYHENRDAKWIGPYVRWKYYYLDIWGKEIFYKYIDRNTMPIFYSFGPNGVDDNGDSDDINFSDCTKK